MRVRILTTVVAGMILAGTTGVAAPPAQAFVCRRVPEQCQVILDELRRHGVCELIPTTSNTWQETAFCDDPDGWSINITRGIVSVVCPDGRCDRLIQDAVARLQEGVDEARARLRALLCTAVEPGC